MLFTENVRPLKITRKYVKAVDQQVFSCGFPESIVEDIKQQLADLDGALGESVKLLTVADIKWEKEHEYSRWCEQQAEDAAAAYTGENWKLTDVEKKIAAFQVMHCTPMEAMQFIIGLQEELHRGNG